MLDPCDLLLPQSKLRLRKTSDLAGGNNEDDNDVFLQEMRNERLQEEIQKEFADKTRAENASMRKVKRDHNSAMSKLQTGAVPILFMVSFHQMLSFLPTVDVCSVQLTSKSAFQYMVGALPLKPRPKGNYPSSSKAKVPVIKPLEPQCQSIFHHYMSTAHFCRAVNLAEFPLLFQYAQLHINSECKSISPAQCAMLCESLPKYDIDTVAKMKQKVPGKAPYTQTIKPLNVNSMVVFMDKDIDSTEIAATIKLWKGNELFQHIRVLSLEGSNIGLASLHLLCNVFKHKANVLACLESLNLSRNAMGPEGVSYLKKTLYHFTPSDRVSDTPITVPRLHTIDVSNNNAQDSALLFFENGLYLTGGEDEEEDDGSDNTKEKGIDIRNRLIPRPNIEGFFTCSRKMKLRSVICRENAYDLMDSELMLAAEVKGISWKFIENVDFSNNSLWESRGKRFLEIMLPVDIEITSRAYMQAVVEADRAEQVTAAAAAEASKVVGSPHMKLAPTKTISAVGSPVKVKSDVPTPVPSPEIIHYRLRILNLANCDLNNAAIEYIAEVMNSGNLQLLEELNLSGNKMSKVSLKTILGVIVKPFVGDNLSESGSATTSPVKNTMSKHKEMGVDRLDAGGKDEGPLMSLIGGFANSLSNKFNGARMNVPPATPPRRGPGTNGVGSEEEESGTPQKLFTSSIVEHEPKCPLLRSLDVSLNPLNSDGMSSLVGVLLRGGLDQLEHLDVSRVSANSDSILVVSRAFNEQYMKPALITSGIPVKAAVATPLSVEEAAGRNHIHISTMRLKTLKLYADIVPLSKKSVCFGQTMLRQVKIS